MIWGEEECPGTGACGNANGMYWFFIAAVKKLLEFHGLKQHKCIILEFWRSEIVLSRLALSVSKGCFSVDPKKKSILLTFPASVGCLHHGLWPLPHLQNLHHLKISNSNLPQIPQILL